MTIIDHSLWNTITLHLLRKNVRSIIYSTPYSFIHSFLSYSYADLSLRYSLTLGSCHSAGHQMKRKLMGILRLKCHALFLDLKVREIMF